jgi:hypothetical protein
MGALHCQSIHPFLVSKKLTGWVVLGVLSARSGRIEARESVPFIDLWKPAFCGLIFSWLSQRCRAEGEP